VSQPTYVSDCPFCGIAKGDDPAELLVETDEWLAFFPLEPATVGHTLVIPRTHVTDLWEAPPELAALLTAAAIDVGRAIDAALHPDGMNLITSAGKTAEQTVFHLHLHLVPRWSDDGFGRIWPREGTPETDALAAAAQSIRTALKR
jgi:histidine triad (HIT) family protein